MKCFLILITFAVFCHVTEANWRLSYKLKLYFSNAGSFADYNQTTATSLLSNPNFNAANPTVLYLYGFTQNEATNTVIQMRNAYINAGYNFILFDVSGIHYNNLFIDEISNQIAQNLLSLFNAGLNLATFEVTGFSLGAQFTGYIGRYVKSLSNNTVILPKLFALEPAALSPENLGPSDAAFVMTVHTGNTYSNETVLGHVAFYPNGGLNQFMCDKKWWIFSIPDTVCTHGQVQQFWTEAVQSATSFPARPCSSETAYYQNACNSATPIGYMNPKVDINLRGKYYLTTNRNSPFSKTSPNP